VLIPAVENAIAGNAYRPGDVFKTRKGLHIEIGNTDAEGRVILCDALAYGAEGQPELMIDLATLTGAARVALGGQLPALFCRAWTPARDLVDRGLALHDPLWHLPLWRDYHGGIESEHRRHRQHRARPAGRRHQRRAVPGDFVPPQQDWLHIDLFAWNDSARPGRPVGGEAQTLRTLLGVVGQDGLEAALVHRHVHVAVGLDEAMPREVLAAVGHAGQQQAVHQALGQHGSPRAGRGGRRGRR
jgi:leucyl aminopeptidase